MPGLEWDPVFYFYDLKMGSRQKQGKNPLVIAGFGNLAEPKGNFSGFSDCLPGSPLWE
jgi:hypothetical protein